MLVDWQNDNKFQTKGLLERQNGKRNGFWKIKNDNGT
jgi:hypothetical protein